MLLDPAFSEMVTRHSRALGHASVPREPTGRRQGGLTHHAEGSTRSCGASRRSLRADPLPEADFVRRGQQFVEGRAGASRPLGLARHAPSWRRRVLQVSTSAPAPAGLRDSAEGSTEARAACASTGRPVRQPWRHGQPPTSQPAGRRLDPPASRNRSSGRVPDRAARLLRRAGDRRTSTESRLRASGAANRDLPTPPRR